MWLDFKTCCSFEDVIYASTKKRKKLNTRNFLAIFTCWNVLSRKTNSPNHCVTYVASIACNHYLPQCFGWSTFLTLGIRGQPFTHRLWVHLPTLNLTQSLQHMFYISQSDWGLCCWVTFILLSNWNRQSQDKRRDALEYY